MLSTLPLCVARCLDVSAFEVLKLLVELCYAGIYTRHTWDGPTLPHETLLHLITVANMFEFNECIESCCEELRTGLSTDVALAVINSLSHLEPARAPINKLVDDAIGSMSPLEGLWSQGRFHFNEQSAVKVASIDKIRVGKGERESF